MSPPTAPTLSDDCALSTAPGMVAVKIANPMWDEPTLQIQCVQLFVTDESNYATREESFLASWLQPLSNDGRAYAVVFPTLGDASVFIAAQIVYIDTSNYTSITSHMSATLRMVLRAPITPEIVATYLSSESTGIVVARAPSEIDPDIADESIEFYNVYTEWAVGTSRFTAVQTIDAFTPVTIAVGEDNVPCNVIEGIEVPAGVAVHVQIQAGNHAANPSPRVMLSSLSGAALIEDDVVPAAPTMTVISLYNDDNSYMINLIIHPSVIIGAAVPDRYEVVFVTPGGNVIIYTHPITEPGSTANISITVELDPALLTGPGSLAAQIAVIASLAEGGVSSVTSTPIDIKLPIKPGSFSATPDFDRPNPELVLEWISHEKSAPRVFGQVQYEVSRSDTNWLSYTIVGTTTEDTLTDSDLAVNKVYQYRIVQVYIHDDNYELRSDNLESGSINSFSSLPVPVIADVSWGHVDEEGSSAYTFQYAPSDTDYTIESVTVSLNGGSPVGMVDEGDVGEWICSIQRAPHAGTDDAVLTVRAVNGVESELAISNLTMPMLNSVANPAVYLMDNNRLFMHCERPTNEGGDPNEAFMTDVPTVSFNCDGLIANNAPMNPIEGGAGGYSYVSELLPTGDNDMSVVDVLFKSYGTNGQVFDATSSVDVYERAPAPTNISYVKEMISSTEYTLDVVGTAPPALPYAGGSVDIVLSHSGNVLETDVYNDPPSSTFALTRITSTLDAAILDLAFNAPDVAYEAVGDNSASVGDAGADVVGESYSLPVFWNPQIAHLIIERSAMDEDDSSQRHQIDLSVSEANLYPSLIMLENEYVFRKRRSDDSGANYGPWETMVAVVDGEGNISCTLTDLNASNTTRRQYSFGIRFKLTDSTDWSHTWSAPSDPVSILRVDAPTAATVRQYQEPNSEGETSMAWAWTAPESEFVYGYLLNPGADVVRTTSTTGTLVSSATGQIDLYATVRTQGYLNQSATDALFGEYEAYPSSSAVRDLSVIMDNGEENVSFKNPTYVTVGHTDAVFLIEVEAYSGNGLSLGFVDLGGFAYVAYDSEQTVPYTTTLGGVLSFPPNTASVVTTVRLLTTIPVTLYTSATGEGTVDGNELQGIPSSLSTIVGFRPVITVPTSLPTLGAVTVQVDTGVTYIGPEQDGVMLRLYYIVVYGSAYYQTLADSFLPDPIVSVTVTTSMINRSLSEESSHLIYDIVVPAPPTDKQIDAIIIHAVTIIGSHLAHHPIPMPAIERAQHEIALLE